MRPSRSSALPKTAGLLLVALLVVGSAAGLAMADVEIIEHPIGRSLRHPQGIAKGPDGNLWFTLGRGSNAIGRMTTKGVVTTFPLPGDDDDYRPHGITAGPDGNLWFTFRFDPDEDLAAWIGRITPSGEITLFPTPTPPSRPWGITSGPDGNVWFTELAVRMIGRITPTGTITEFPLPEGAEEPANIVAGPDGAMWFTASKGNAIGRITITGTDVTLFPLPAPGSVPHDITVGPDGALWFTEQGGEAIGRITTSGAITEFPVPQPAVARLQGITAGPDGNIWFTETRRCCSGGRPIDFVGRLSPSTGDLHRIATPSRQAHPLDIVPGPNRTLWFTEREANNIGVVIRESFDTP
jgi:streptogramin lyase